MTGASSPSTHASTPSGCRDLVLFHQDPLARGAPALPGLGGSCGPLPAATDRGAGGVGDLCPLLAPCRQVPRLLQAHTSACAPEPHPRMLSHPPAQTAARERTHAAAHGRSTARRHGAQVLRGAAGAAPRAAAPQARAHPRLQARPQQRKCTRGRTATRQRKNARPRTPTRAQGRARTRRGCPVPVPVAVARSAPAAGRGHGGGGGRRGAGRHVSGAGRWQVRAGRGGRRRSGSCRSGAFKAPRRWR